MLHIHYCTALHGVHVMRDKINKHNSRHEKHASVIEQLLPESIHGKLRWIQKMWIITKIT